MCNQAGATGRIIDAIEALPHFETFACSKCGRTIRAHVLQIYAICSGCGTEHKCRAFGGIGTEIEDVIDAVLLWIARGDVEAQAEVWKRQREMVADRDDGVEDASA